MPCQSWDSDECTSRENREQLHKVTRMLCGICERVDNMSKWDEYPNPFDILGLIGNTKELNQWWGNHKALDAKKEKQEAEAVRKTVKASILRESAMAKLTSEEYKSLKNFIRSGDAI